MLSGTASANYKMVIQHAKDPKDDVSLFNIDTGINGNPFQGNYFNLNRGHLDGHLLPMKWNA